MAPSMNEAMESKLRQNKISIEFKRDTFIGDDRAMYLTVNLRENPKPNVFSVVKSGGTMTAAWFKVNGGDRVRYTEDHGKVYTGRVVEGADDDSWTIDWE